MSSPTKTSSLRNLSFTPEGVSFLVEGQSEVTRLAADTAAAQALEAFYQTALKELLKENQAIGNVLSRSTAEKLAREAAAKGAAGTIKQADTVTTEASKGVVFGWLRNRLKSLFSSKKETPSNPAPAPTATAAAIQRASKREIEESPVGKLPVLGGRDAPEAGAFRPQITPARQALATPAPAAKTSPAPTAQAISPSVPAAVEPTISEVFADERGITIRWSNDHESFYGPKHELSGLLMAAYGELIKAKVDVQGVDAVAAAWNGKAMEPVHQEAAPVVQQEPTDNFVDREPEIPGDIPMGDESDREYAAGSPPDTFSAPPAPAEHDQHPGEEKGTEQPVRVATPSAPISAPVEPSPGQIDAAVASVSPEEAAPAPEPAEASPVPSAPAKPLANEAPAASAPHNEVAVPPSPTEVAAAPLNERVPAEVASQESPDPMTPLPVRIINEDGSKVSLALLRNDGSPILLDLDDLDAHAIKAALSAEKGPKLTHMAHVPQGGAGPEGIALFFDNQVDGPGLTLAKWQESRSQPALSPAAITPREGQPPFPCAPTKITLGTRPVGAKDIDA